MWATNNSLVLLKRCLEIALLHTEMNRNSSEAGEELFLCMSYRRSELQFSYSLLTIK